MTDMVIPPEAVAAVALAFARTQTSMPWESYSAATQQLLIENAMPTALAGLEDALPHFRPMLELAGNLGRGLGRRELGEDIAAAFDREAELIEALPDDDEVRPQVRDILRARRAAFRDSAHIAREIATKEPK